jgi:hypothetical protein
MPDSCWGFPMTPGISKPTVSCQLHNRLVYDSITFTALLHLFSLQTFIRLHFALLQDINSLFHIW